MKNGPIDFQPREPFSPLFGAMPQTPLMMEFQLTQEYLGQGTHLVFEAPLFKEVLNADTYSKGKGFAICQPRTDRRPRFNPIRIPVKDKLKCSGSALAKKPLSRKRTNPNRLKDSQAAFCSREITPWFVSVSRHGF